MAASVMKGDHFPGAELDLGSGWMNAAGMLGFAPPPVWPLPVAPVAFVTNPISYKPRYPAVNRNLIVFPGGVLLHSGSPNPGFARVLKDFSKRWSRSEVPVWVHILGEDPAGVQAMVRKLEDIDGVRAIELGLPPKQNPVDWLDMIQAAVGELPLVLNIPLDCSDSTWLQTAAKAGVSAISLGAPRGSVRGVDGSILQGRIYGPALMPQTLMAVNRLKGIGIPIIAGGGVFGPGDMHTLLDAGAVCVQLDLALWRGWEVEG